MSVVRRPHRRIRRWMPLCLAAGLPCGCVPSNVVATEQRMVASDPAELTFEPAVELQLDGLWASVEIRGQAAATLRKVYYLFATDGTYTAAALTEADGAFAFQTLNGTWRNDSAGLVLDGAEPVRIERAENHLRLSTDNGVLVLRRERGL